MGVTGGEEAGGGWEASREAIVVVQVRDRVAGDGGDGGERLRSGERFWKQNPQARAGLDVGVLGGRGSQDIRLSNRVEGGRE